MTVDTRVVDQSGTTRQTFSLVVGVYPSTSTCLNTNGSCIIDPNNPTTAPTYYWWDIAIRFTTGHDRRTFTTTMSLRLHLLLSWLLLLIVLAVTSLAQEPNGVVESQLPSFANGANCLFIGNSFFIPVAVRFGGIASTSNGFNLHDTDYVYTAGGDGSPRALWNDANEKAAAQQKLSTGQIELFGMTSMSSEGIIAVYQDYRNWIDLALSYNSETTFFIGSPWIPNGPTLNTTVFAVRTLEASETTFQVVRLLRATYPGTSIFFLNYGQVASKMRSMFDAGNLPDITQINGPGANSLFGDATIGLGGAMMLEMSALLWMSVLYGASYQDLTYNNQYNQDSVTAILEDALLYHASFNTNATDYEVQPPSIPGLIAGFISALFFCF